jgi:hypothetical protein
MGQPGPFVGRSVVALFATGGKPLRHMGFLLDGYLIERVGFWKGVGGVFGGVCTFITV